MIVQVLGKYIIMSYEVLGPLGSRVLQTVAGVGSGNVQGFLERGRQLSQAPKGLTPYVGKAGKQRGCF